MNTSHAMYTKISTQGVMELTRDI